MVQPRKFEQVAISIAAGEDASGGLEKAITSQYDKFQLEIGVHAQAVFTVTGQPSDTNTVVVGAKTYTYQTTLTDVDGNVQIGADAEGSIDNIVAAINLTGTPGTDYALSMTKHTIARAVKISATVFHVIAIAPGVAGSLLASTETHALGSYDVATFEDDTATLTVEVSSDDGVTYRQVKEDSVDDSFDAIPASKGLTILLEYAANKIKITSSAVIEITAILTGIYR